MLVGQGDGENLAILASRCVKATLTAVLIRSCALTHASACVKAASRPSPCVKFWSGNKVVMKAFPEVKGLVTGYLPFQKAYTLLLEGEQFPQALQERLYSPAGMPGQARIEVGVEEIMCGPCDRCGKAPLPLYEGTLIPGHLDRPGLETLSRPLKAIQGHWRRGCHTPPREWWHVPAIRDECHSYSGGIRAYRASVVE